MVKDSSTERRIIDAARRVFIRKGMVGARMQEIADEAGINKALLHYYFRSKEKLFDQILIEVIGKISAGLKEIFTRDLSVLDRLVSLVDVYLDVLSENRYLPFFVLNEMNHNPKKFASLIQKYMLDYMKGFMIQVEEEAGKGLIRPVQPMHLLLNVLGMVIFPVSTYPIINEIADENMKPFLEQFFSDRKAIVKDFIIHAIKP